MKTDHTHVLIGKAKWLAEEMARHLDRASEEHDALGEKNVRGTTFFLRRAAELAEFAMSTLSTLAELLERIEEDERREANEDALENDPEHTWWTLKCALEDKGGNVESLTVRADADEEGALVKSIPVEDLARMAERPKLAVNWCEMASGGYVNGLGLYRVLVRNTALKNPPLEPIHVWVIPS